MSRWLCILLLVCAQAQAAPTTSGAGASNLPAAGSAISSDEIDRVLAERGIFRRIDTVRQSVSDKASDLVVHAMGFLGVPYRRGGNTADTGFDCSGFVRAIYEETVGKLLPRRAAEQAASTDKIDRADLKPGDLVFFNTMRRAFSHVGIYVGDNKFIHAPKPGAEVRVEDLRTAYWQRRFDGARRVQAEDVDQTASVR
ncbi:C40 family peptidase [Xylophilus sp.]|uniref:C40 family peptidase n=1 Tax=Xylophilus sp. TaxID=2653893 RepID=UPI0013B723E5|nr:C40 family peptidase [Xylophilus sp.]KAF1047303.1 MAG: Murein DD-endopeptidase MepH [Xylophilus sp.]